MIGGLSGREVWRSRIQSICDATATATAPRCLTLGITRGPLSAGAATEMLNPFESAAIKSSDNWPSLSES
jgi:hypothetical protein